MRFVWVLLLFFFFSVPSFGQGKLSGTVVDEAGKALERVSVQLQSLGDSTKVQTLTDGDGAFAFGNIIFGYYRIRFSYVGLQPKTLDSLWFRAERADFNLSGLVLKPKQSDSMEAIVVYAEKPLIQSRDGNITFNAGESALSQGSNAGDLLTQVPLVTKDPSGKVLVRGKEPKILIDDKPVELNLQQLQDLLESMPGSSIEKIEVMTNPPPQYANEQGGVINIVLRKGTVGKSARLNVFAGTRGEAGLNGNFSYRKNKLSLNANAGASNNAFVGEGYSVRQNLYADSSNHFNTANGYSNRSLRPNLRLSVDYEISKQQLVNAVATYNQNTFDNDNGTTFQNLNRFDQLYRLSTRSVLSTGDGYNPNLSVNYTYKTKLPGEVLRVFSNFNFSENNNKRTFYQQYLNPDYSFTGNDSTQLQLTGNRTKGYSLRLAYDLPLANKKTFLSVGGYYNHAASDIDVNALYRRKGDGALLGLDLLSNHFLFQQAIANLRGSVKQLLAPNFSVSGGLSVEETSIHFDLLKTGADTGNRYWTVLPFANVNKTWANNVNLTLSYRRSIRRPGINELNPTKDFSDPYNLRSGNPTLLASPAHNFDFVLGRSKGTFYGNVGLGYNIVQDIFVPLRTILANGYTETVWQNISGRKEYEASTWAGYTFNRKLRSNLSASYTFNRYSEYDKQVRRYRDGGSLTSNLNTVFTASEFYNASGSITFNRFANPQGTVRNSVSMNLALQAKLFQKKLTLTLNAIDPFFQQQAHTFTYGTNGAGTDFVVENFSRTQTRNYRLTVGYNFAKAPIKKKLAVSGKQ